MKSLFIIGAVVLMLNAVTMNTVEASSKIAGNSAVFASVSVKGEDYRVKKLRAYLEARNSPLAPHAQVFISAADRYNLDWKFLVSVSGVESGYGINFPAGSHNGWGWGYRNGTVMHFTSWEEAIQTISRDIREKYMEKRGAQNIHDIGRVYAANPHWASRVQYFMNRLEAYEPKVESLPISI